MPTTKIKQLQQLQKDRLNGQNLSQLPQDTQISFCRTNKEIGELAYHLYDQMKLDSSKALEAAHYLMLAVNCCNSKAFDEINKQLPNNNLDGDIRSVVPLKTAEEIFHLGICYLLGMAGYVQNSKI